MNTNPKYMEDTKVQLNYSASAVSVDCKGKYAVLGARRGLCVITLDRPWEKKFLYHNKKCEVGAVQFCPHLSRCSYVANTASDTVQVWDIVNKNTPLINSFKGHNSAITGLVWSPEDENVLGTCSTDSYLKLWDLRDASKPVRSFCAFTSTPSQLRWNPLSAHILASAHDGEVRIWDTRKTDTYVAFITAHFSSISSLDWSPKKSEQLVTCAQDRHIKIWDINMPREFKITTMTAKPVSKIRYTPFGEGLVTVSAKNDFQIRLWSITNEELVNINVFPGHTDVVKSFDFRNRSARSRSNSISNYSSGEFTDYQLVTWSKDQTLRLWTLNQQMQEDCGHIVTESIGDPLLGKQTPDLDSSSDALNQSNIAFSEGSNPSSVSSTLSSSIRGWIRKNKKALNSELNENMTYPQECTKVANEYDQVTLEENNPVTRSCTFRIDLPKCTIRLKVIFPSMYPRGATPMFEFLPSKSSLSIHNMKILKEQLNKTADELCLQQNRLCMSSCIHDFLEILVSMDISESPRVDEVVTPSDTTKTPRSSRIEKIEKLQEMFPEPSTSEQDFKQNGKAISSSPATMKPIRKTSIVKTDDRKVPSPATAFGYFTPTGQFVYVNSFSMRDFSNLSSSSSTEDNTKAAAPARPKGLYMKTYEEWKRKMFVRRRGRTASEVASESPIAEKHSKSSVNSQDYFQNFFSGYSSRDLRSPSPLPDENNTEKADGDNDNDIDHDLDTITSTSPSTDALPVSQVSLISPPSKSAPPNPALLQQQQLQQQAIKSRLQHQIQDPHAILQSKPSTQRRGSRAKRLDLRVFVYTIPEVGASPISLELAREYSVFGTNIRQICENCKHACLNNNKPEIAKIWEVIAEIADETLCPDRSHLALWSNHPLGRQFVSNLFDHYLKQRDIQMLAMLSCVLAIPQHELKRRNNSEERFSLLDSRHEPLYNHLRSFYADILHRWNLNCQRNEIMKFITSSSIVNEEKQSHDCSIEIVKEQDQVMNRFRLPSIHDHYDSDNTDHDEDAKSHPKHLFFKCSLCRLPAKGLYIMCSNCGHGGHVEHMKSWFSSNECCASGCGCSCVDYMDLYPVTVSHSNVTEESATGLFSATPSRLSLPTAISGLPIDQDELMMDTANFIKKSTSIPQNMHKAPSSGSGNGTTNNNNISNSSNNSTTPTQPLRTPNNKFKFRLYDYNQDWY